MKFDPRPHQQRMLDFIKSNSRCALFSFMGSGKTSGALSAIDRVAGGVLIIAPLQVANNTWPNEFKKWDFTSGYEVSLLTGTPAQRAKAYQTRGKFCVVNYENLPWLVELTGNTWPFKTVIVDECTKLKGFRTRQGSKRAKALAKVIHTLVDRVILLTGTPAPNGLLDLWGQIWFIDKGERLGASFSKFCERWFYPDYTGYNWLPKKGAQDEIQEAIKDICLTIKAEDWFRLDEPIVNVIRLALPAKAHALYKKMEKEMFIELEQNPVEALNAASCQMKCRQIASGAIYSDTGTDVIHDVKIKALESIIEESNGANILVAYYFKSDLERLQKAFPQGLTLSSKDSTMLGNFSAEKMWNNNEIKLLFVHPDSAGMGLNLQDGGNTLVFFNVDWKMESHVQLIERIGPMRQKQSGYDRNVFIHYILAEDTVDDLIYERLSTKKEVQQVLLNAMKAHKGEK